MPEDDELSDEVSGRGLFGRGLFGRGLFSGGKGWREEGSLMRGGNVRGVWLAMCDCCCIAGCGSGVHPDQSGVFGG